MHSINSVSINFNAVVFGNQVFNNYVILQCHDNVSYPYTHIMYNINITFIAPNFMTATRKYDTFPL